MPAVLDDSGLQIPTQAELEEEVKASISGAFPGLNLGADSPFGELITAQARQLRAAYELLSAAYAAGDINQATGRQLGFLTKLTGTPQNPASASLVTCTCDLDAGSYAAGDLVAHVLGDPTARFANRDAVTSPGGSNSVVFEAEATGPVRANAGTLTVIAETVVGWNSVTNPLDATLGSLIEQDAALRVRQAQELDQAGSNRVDAIRANLYLVEGVTFADVLENVTDSTDSNGLPPHSLNAIVLGGDPNDVCESLFSHKPGGIQLYAGATNIETENVTDDKNNVHVVSFNRPATVSIYLDITLTVDADTYSGDTELKQAVVDWGDSTLGVGDDVTLSRIVATIFQNVTGILDVTLIEVGNAPSPSQTTNYVIAPREIADLDTGRINLTVTTL